TTYTGGTPALSEGSQAEAETLASGSAPCSSLIRIFGSRSSRNAPTGAPVDRRFGVPAGASVARCHLLRASIQIALRGKNFSFSRPDAILRAVGNEKKIFNAAKYELALCQRGASGGAGFRRAARRTGPNRRHQG